MARPKPHPDSRALVALASPVRQDIVVALEGSGPLTVAELAWRLGRRADALYHHLRALDSAGLVSPEPRGSTGGRPGSAWRLRMRVVQVPSHVATGPNARQAERIAGAMTRSSLRDYRRALRAAEEGTGPRPSASRSSVWLDAGERRELEEAIAGLVRRLRANEPRDGRTPHVITYLLAPMAGRGPASPSPSQRKATRKEPRQ